MTEPKIRAIELGCWTGTALMPILAWINGPAVSPDQTVIRWTVTIATVATAVTIRIRTRLPRKPANND